MNTNKFMGGVLAAVLLVLVSCGKEDTGDEETKDLENSGKVAAESIKETLSQWERRLATVDEDFASWREIAEAKAATASEEAKLSIQETIAALDEQRRSLAAKVEEAKIASGENWDNLRAAVERGWTEFERSLDAAKKDLR